ncbi:type III secretion protein Q [Roseateles sp. YR242]|uniref:FliM/FliN family flagellar motor switch protein n=1 Tax=Roseateles sp. YR242 TaxID=1855305 RepID=UPI0008C096BF|nr:FliM/FliN family flagellar motor switch protein [Roseateles sp. YR242]SEK24632.1 type III secretion protein Q [Roseateles sp. YR242]
MNSLPTTAATTALASGNGLAGRLPSMSPADAALSRITQDSRFCAWLRATLQQASLGVALRQPDAAWRLTVESAHGRFQLGLDAADSPALQLALSHQPHDTACAVVMLLLDDWAQALAPALGPLRLVRIEPLPPGPRVPCILGGAMPVALLEAEPSLLDHMAATMAQPGVDLTPMAGCLLRPVIRLFTRALSPQVLRTLRPGDAVLASGQSAWLRCGVGHVLQARLHLDPQEFTVHLAESPMSTDDPADLDPNEGAHGIEAPPAAGSLESLQLPVAFELSTARVSLAELASMQPGYAVELDVPLQEAEVRLVCHGRTLGLGQLIAIGDQLGVRITRLEFSHDAAAAR